MAQRYRRFFASCAIFGSFLVAWHIGSRPLSAREIPDLLGNPKQTAAPKTGEGGWQDPFPTKEGLAPPPRPQPKAAVSAPASLRNLLPQVMRKAFYLADGTGYWLARWIHPDGEESPPIPLWIDSEGNGHFLFQAAVVLGEDSPLLVRAPRISASQVLSLFREADGTFLPVASDVWIELPRNAGEKEFRWTGKGAWRSSTALIHRRNVFSPFVPALQNASDPEIRACASFRWPDVVLLHLPGEPPIREETEEVVSESRSAE
ncbi:hypothetical protein MAMC_00609 [Methylacidimicrobium cyclopophantes]|uniref:Uncharacterized protein n=1 Tax=Methylacidimicrobium cyclopophantes TaxID=1041766 RepID=A0A5E6M8B6_9BACT|nr:hypothetical protein [Methylacidimicrobium cyclopophantes]VVM05477.1 hypothetical protein MAMC_00609 [Methylacidimicrobium cyclopophantes]